MIDNTRYSLHLDHDLTNAAADILYSINGCQVLQVSFEALEIDNIHDEALRPFFGLIDFRIVNNSITLERILEILNQELLPSLEITDHKI